MIGSLNKSKDNSRVSLHEMEEVKEDFNQRVQNFEEREKLEKMRLVKEMAENIMSLYPEGINDMFDEEDYSEHTVGFIYTFHCPNYFYDKFSKNIENDNVSVIDDSHRFHLKSLGFQKKLQQLLQSAPPQVGIHLSEEKARILDMKILHTLEYRELIKESFEDIDKFQETLINTIVDKQALLNAEEQKNRDPEYISNSYTMDRLNGLPYYELHFEDYILIFFRILRYFTNLRVKLEISRIPNKLHAKVFARSEEDFDEIAETCRYPLQLKPYAYTYLKYKYQVYRNKIEELLENEMKNDQEEVKENEGLVVNENQNLNRKKNSNLNSIDKVFPNLQFSELDENNAFHWPPYVEFEKAKSVKFRRYEKNDLYHECNHDPELTKNNLRIENENIIEDNDECSKYRTIDKLRLIHLKTDSIVKFKTLNESTLLDNIIIKRDHKVYEDTIHHELSLYSIVFSNLNIFLNKEQLRLTNQIRNFFGEKVSFYFLWVLFWCRWLVVPAGVGVVVSIIQMTSLNKFRDIRSVKGLSFNYYDFTLFAYSVLIAIWGSSFIKVWKQKEKVYSYLWGMEHYEQNEPNQEEFKPNEIKKFLFGVNLQVYPKWKKNLKIILSYIVVLCLVVINTFIVFMLFRWRAHMTNNGHDQNLFWPVIIGLINGCQIKIMSVIDIWIINYLAHWENHEKFSEMEKHIIVKVIMFEFMNNYLSIFYIAFYKPYKYEVCMQNNCLKEVEILVYCLLFVSFLFQIWEVVWAYISSHYKKKALINDIKKNNPQFNETNFEIVPLSYEHQLIYAEKTTLIYNYNRYLILFGYICFFSVAAPITPLIVFIIIYMGKSMDAYCLFNLNNVKNFDGASGIGIYKRILEVLYFVGMIVSIAIVLFTSPGLINTSPYDKTDLLYNSDFTIKVVVIAIIENLILFLISFINYNSFPDWFEYLTLINSLYIRKYYNKETKDLPHKNINSEKQTEFEDDEGEDFFSKFAMKMADKNKD